MAKGVLKGYGCVSPLGNGRHISYQETADLIEKISSGTQKAYVVDKIGWTLQVSGFLPIDAVPTVGTVTTVSCSFGGGACIVTSVSRSADVGGLAAYDVTFTGTA